MTSFPFPNEELSLTLVNMTLDCGSLLLGLVTKFLTAFEIKTFQACDFDSLLLDASRAVWVPLLSASAGRDYTRAWHELLLARLSPPWASHIVSAQYLQRLRSAVLVPNHTCVSALQTCPWSRPASPGCGSVCGKEPCSPFPSSFNWPWMMMYH